MAYPTEVIATMRRLLLTSSIVLTAAPVAAQSLPENWPAAVAEFHRHAIADSTVGAALVLVRDGQIIAEEYHGLADRSKGIPASRETIWHWGSITKTLTAVSLMQLVERGRVSLDQPAVDLVPELRRIHNPYGPMSDITVRMLLSHSSGLQSGTWPWSRGENWEPFEPTEWSQLVAMMPYMRLGFEPGSRYGYSNPGIVYLARMIEEKSGDPWQGYIHKNIFLPLRLESSYFGNTPWHLAERRSHNYAVTRDGVADRGSDFDPGITIPNGGWNASVQDIAGWMGYLSGSSDPARRKLYDTILPRPVLEQMWQPIVRVNEEEEMGLSFFLRNTDGHKLIGHTGTQANFRSFFWLDPESGLGIIGVVNTSSAVDGRASTERFNELMRVAREVL